MSSLEGGDAHLAAPWRGYRMKADKGINLPESDFTIPALTAKDLQDLSFAAPHADLINDSFVDRVADIEALQQHCAERGISEVALVLKIEPLQAVRDLPRLLLAAMARPAPLGGDDRPR